MHVRRALLFLSVIPIAAVALLFAWHGRGPSRPSIDTAVGRFRASSSTVPTAGQSLVPPAGVYVYAGSGEESLSFMDTHQRQGPQEPGTVTVAASGCWTLRLDFNTFHSQTWERCVENGKLAEHGGTTTQKFDFLAFKQSEHSVVTCDPPMIVADPAASVGSHSSATCLGHSQTTNANITQEATITYLARDSILVGNSAIPALHTREAIQFSGDQHGNETVDVWFASDTGLPLREQHTLSVVSPAPAPLNRVTYTESGNWQLTSLQPKR